MKHKYFKFILLYTSPACVKSCALIVVLASAFSGVLSDLDLNIRSVFSQLCFNHFLFGVTKKEFKSRICSLIFSLSFVHSFVTRAKALKISTY